MARFGRSLDGLQHPEYLASWLKVLRSDSRAIMRAASAAQKACDLIMGDADGDDDEGSGGALGEFAQEALGRALSERGGFGIATSIVKQLSHAGNQNGTEPVTGKLHSDTVIKLAE